MQPLQVFKKLWPSDSRYELQLQVWEQSVNADSGEIQVGAYVDVVFKGDRSLGSWDFEGQAAGLTIGGRSRTKTYTYDFRESDCNVWPQTYETLDFSANPESPSVTVSAYADNNLLGRCSISVTYALTPIPRGLIYVGTSLGVKRGQVYVGTSQGVMKAKAVYLGTSAGVRKST